MLRRTGQWQGNRPPDNQAANKLVDAGGSWFEDVGSTPTASIFFVLRLSRGGWADLTKSRKNTSRQVKNFAQVSRLR